MSGSTNISLKSEEGTIPLPHERIAQQREDARKWVARAITSSFVFIITASFFLFLFRGQTPVDDIIKFISSILTPVIGIVGAVTGFYFSESRHLHGHGGGS